MSVTVLYSQSRRAQSKALADLYVNPPLLRVGMLEWSRFDAIVQQGYEHGCRVLDELDPAMQARLGLRPA